MLTRLLLFTGLVAFAVVVLTAAGAQGPPRPAPYTVVAREGRRPLPVAIVAGQEMAALDDLAALFQLVIREDALAGGLTVTDKGRTIILTPSQGIASVNGRLIALPSAPAREGGRWFVPLDFIGRALALVHEPKLDVRKPSRLIVVGDLRVPRVVARVDPQPAQTRVTFEISPPTAHAIAQEADRLLIKFEADAVDAALPPLAPGDVVQELRVSDPGTTIAIVTTTRFGSFRATDMPAENNVARLIIDLIPSGTPTTVLQPPTAAPAAPDIPQLFESSPASAIRTIVIDPGHGGADEGARGPGGTMEKNVALSVARRLKGAIEARLGIRVLLTREGDQAIGLDQRAAIANNNKADLFLSLHASASLRPAVSGAEIFTLSLDEYGEEAQRAAASSAQTLLTFGGGAREIEVIRWEMAQARYIAQSTALAGMLEERLRARVPMSPRARQRAPLRVLVGANMPAALVELGFLTNREQEKQLASDSFQNDAVQALVDTVMAFRDHLEARAAPPGARP